MLQNTRVLTKTSFFLSFFGCTRTHFHVCGCHVYDYDVNSSSVLYTVVHHSFTFLAADDAFMANIIITNSLSKDFLQKSILGLKT